METLIKLWQVVRFILFRTFVDPIREGHLKQNRAHPWPVGFRWLVGISVGLYALLTLLGLAAPRLRAIDLVADADLSLPWVTAPFLVLAAIVGLSLGYVAAIHAGWRVQVPLGLILLVVLGGTPGGQGVGLILTGVVLVLLLAFALWRRRRPFSLWEFVVAVLLIGAVLLQRLLAPFFFGVSLNNWGLGLLGYWTSLLTIITTPSALLAGAAMTEIAIALGTWTARGVWEAVPGPDPRPRLRAMVGGSLLSAVVLGAVAREVQLALTEVNMDLTGLAWATGYVLVAALTGLLVLRLAPGGRAPGVPTDADDLSSSWSRTSWPLALILGASVFGTLFLSLFLSLFGVRQQALEWAQSQSAVFCGLAAIGLGVWWARRGRTAPAILAAVFGIGLMTGQLLLRVRIGFDTRQVVSASVLLAVLVLIGLLVTRRLTADRGLAIASLLLVGRVHEFRDVLDEPLAAIFQLTGGGGLLLVGLLWRQLTEYAVTRGHSRTMPHYVRVLLALANMTLIGMAVSQFALAGQPGTAQLQVLENAGDSVLGGALLLAVLVVGLLLGVRGREGGDQRPGEEFRVDHLILVEPKSLPTFPEPVPTFPEPVEGIDPDTTRVRPREQPWNR
ncbi:hypothetical protein CGZ93_02135 [Enemella dayhoffiae]|uniref:Uncharacterized protein n=1 Tax=Enemella dayhoffiae TaxID=2016507 RepID=A0A255HC45_9ACTN|nr:hypothetical protein [Enemella dayhoffiae]OYO25265.1 hypothetical protein CGZ93_02135 [Enemella dayhoffiae]